MHNPLALLKPFPNVFHLPLILLLLLVFLCAYFAALPSCCIPFLPPCHIFTRTSPKGSNDPSKLQLCLEVQKSTLTDISQKATIMVPRDGTSLGKLQASLEKERCPRIVRMKMHEGGPKCWWGCPKLSLEMSESALETRSKDSERRLESW